MKQIVQVLLLHLALGDPNHQGPDYPKYHQPGLVQQYQPPQVVCLTHYETVWDTTYNQVNTQVCTKQYKKVCKIDQREVCVDTYKPVCYRVVENKCHTTYHQVCGEEYRKEYEHYRETECTTLKKEHCEHRWEGEGNEKIWVAIPGTCVSNTYDVCNDIPKTKEKLIPYTVCNDVPIEECVEVPRDECKQVPKKICKNEPFETCETVPIENCEEEVRKVPVRFSRKIPKQVCNDDQYQYTDVQASGYNSKSVIQTQAGQDVLQAVFAVPVPPLSNEINQPTQILV